MGGAVVAFDVTNYGASGANTGDQSGAIQDAIDACAVAGGGEVYFPPGAYRMTSGVAVSASYTRLVGEGFASRIVFVPDEGASAVVFDRGDEQPTLNYCGIEHMGFAASVEDEIVKVAIDARDVSSFTCCGVRIGPWTGGGASVGLRLRGRESLSLRDLRLAADLPIRISVNDRNELGSLDHAAFVDCYLLTTVGSEQPCILLDDGVRLSNVRFAGFQAWAGGGLEWISATDAGASWPLSLCNVRTEQIRKEGQHSIRIELPASSPLRSLRLESCAFDQFRPAVKAVNVNAIEAAPAPIWGGAGSWLQHG